MKENISEFLKLQNDRMKSPFFSAIVFSLLFYNWDVLYYLFSYDADILAKIGYVKSELPKKSLLEPFFLTVSLLIVPLIVNNVIQLISDYISSYRSEKLNRYRISRGKGELEIANLEARKNFEPQRIEAETLHNIEGLKGENNNLNALVASHKEHILELTAALESERVTTSEIRLENKAISNTLKSLQDENEKLNEKVNITLDKYHGLLKSIEVEINNRETGSEPFINIDEIEKRNKQFGKIKDNIARNIIMNNIPNDKLANIANSLKASTPRDELIDSYKLISEEIKERGYLQGNINKNKK